MVLASDYAHLQRRCEEMRQLLAVFMELWKCGLLDAVDTSALTPKFISRMYDALGDAP